MRIIYCAVILLIFCATETKADNFNGLTTHNNLGSLTMQSNNKPLHEGDNLWQIIREGMQLNEVNPDLVRHYEKEFSAQPDYLASVFNRGRSFLFLIASEAKKRDMPMEIVLLPIVESAYRAEATSRTGAAGLWQFMPSTGDDYELTRTWDYDARRDIIRSTHAALNHLQSLYRKFKDWPLALAAYNWGAGSVSRAISKTTNRGQKPTYENITMPNETRHYVPRLLAMRNILLASSKFGLKLDKLPNEPYLASVPIEKNMDISVAAQLADMPLSEFKAFNSGYQLPVLVPDKNRYLVIKKDRLAQFHHNLKAWGDKPLTNWQVYIPESDLPTRAVAENFGMDVAELASVNRLKNNLVLAGKPILVANRPSNNQHTVAYKTTSTPPSAIPTISYDQMIRDNLKQTAFNVESHSQPIVASNQTNHEANSVDTKKSIPTFNEHTVVKGETLSSIARLYHLSVIELKAINQLKSDVLKPRQILKLNKTLVAENSPVKTVNQDTEPFFIEYIVKKGDTLYSIARAFGVHYTAIKVTGNEINRIVPGQRIMISHPTQAK